MASQIVVPKCIAHRGGHLAGEQALPENSLAAIERALTLGVDAIEIDVYQVEGELYVTHDRRLGRVVSGEGVIYQQSRDYLGKQKLMNREPLPRLQQVLELVNGQVLLNIEIKGPEVVADLSNLLREYVGETQGSFDSYILSSFDHRQLYQCLQQLPEVKRGVLIDGVPLDYAACCEPLKAFSLNSHLGFITPELLEDARKRGLQNWVYTVNFEDDWEQMLQLSVDGIFTDKPDSFLAFLKKQQTQALA